MGTPPSTTYYLRTNLLQVSLVDISSTWYRLSQDIVSNYVHLALYHTNYLSHVVMFPRELLRQHLQILVVYESLVISNP